MDAAVVVVDSWFLHDGAMLKGVCFSWAVEALFIFAIGNSKCWNRLWWVY